MIKKIDWKLCIIYACIAVFIALLLAGCSSSKKNVSIKKSHVDSTSVETKASQYLTFLDSTTKKTDSEAYNKTTVIHLEPVEIDSGYIIIDTAPLIVKDKVTGKQKVYLPASTIIEWGNISKSDSAHVLRHIDSAVNEQKATKVISDIKTVDKQKTKIGFNFFWLLLLIPAPLLFKKVRVIIFKFFIP